MALGYICLVITWETAMQAGASKKESIERSVEVGGGVGLRE